MINNNGQINLRAVIYRKLTHPFHRLFSTLNIKTNQQDPRMQTHKFNTNTTFRLTNIIYIYFNKDRELAQMCQMMSLLQVPFYGRCIERVVIAIG